ncbi:MAG: hypothetical protein ACI35P_04350 [Bacillus sp. (in: firmicutes)]
MFLDFLNENDWSSYILVASLLVSFATTFAFVYLSRMSVNSRTAIRPNLRDERDLLKMKAQRSHNEQDCIGHWLALCIRRKESPDDSPSHLLLEQNDLFTIQGGTKWRRNQIVLYPLLLKDSAY